MGRLFLLLIVALGLAPGTWVRTIDLVNRDARQILRIDRLPVPRRDLGGGITAAGAWQLSSPNHHFSGYSALLAMGDGTLLAVTDHRRALRFAPPGAAPAAASFDYFATPDPERDRPLDLEAVTRDPASGYLWAAYERRNQIERSGAALSLARVRPVEMRRWPVNSGPEAMARLADGRFVVLSEGSPRWFADEVPGLLFPGDPVSGAKPERFVFRGPEDFVPVDMTELPDGRVLILLRALRWGLPLHFEGKLVVADPAAITPGEPWPWREIVHLAEPLPMDNYEGVAVEPVDGGRLVLWLISDDNRSGFQRTLLLKLLWRPEPVAREKARETRRAPS